LGFISDILSAILNAINSVVHNYGWSIVIFTIFVRLLLLPLDIKQKKEMKKMSELQPKLKEINEKYKNDADKKNQKTMELYKAEKANPLGGCLPLLIQLPILFALFAVLRQIADQQTIALVDQVRQGVTDIKLESWLWIRNIWQPDSFMASVIPDNVATIKDYAQVMKPLIDKYNDVTNGWFILPVLAGVTQFFQMKYMSTDPNQQQQKGLMYFFPIFSVYITATYNSAFSLYWVVSNLYSIVQQFIFNKFSPNFGNAAKEGKK